MRKVLRAALMLLMIVTATAIVLACSGKRTVSGIEVDKMPKTMYLVGEPLDLTGGELTVMYSNGTEENIPLDSQGITISGYDANKPEEQVLTVTYMGMTTELTVHVIKPIRVDPNVEVDYFVGEQFNTKAGNFVITDSTGKVTTVPVGDPRIEITGFDSSKAAMGQVLTVKFTDAVNNIECTDTITVNIYTPKSQPTFGRRPKTQYYSHEGKVSLSGGYITLEADNGGTPVSKNIALIDSRVTVTGGEFGELEPTDEPIERTVTFTYAGYTLELPITITYSDVSWTKYYLGFFDDIDWSSDDAGLDSDQQITSCMTAMQYYMTLDSKEKSYFSDEELEALGIPAALLCYNYIPNLLDYYEGSFVFESGRLELQLMSYAFVKIHYTELTKDNNQMFALLDMAEAIKNDSLLKDIKFKNPASSGISLGEVCGTFPTKSVFTQTVIPMMKYMLDVYESVEDIPDEWTEENLTDDSMFDELSNLMLHSVYTGEANRGLYDTLSSWRNNNDLFDIIFTHYYAKGDWDTMTDIALHIHLPSELEELYSSTAAVKAHYESISAYEEYDTVYFMYYYTHARELEASIAAKGGMNAELMNEIGFSALGSSEPTIGEVLDVHRDAGLGYYDLNGPMQGIEQFRALWEMYMQVLENRNWNDEYTDEEYYADIDEMFRAFIDMTPAMQYGFLNSAYTLYRSTSYPVFDFDTGSGNPTNIFQMLVMARYLGDDVSEPVKEAVQELLVTIENFARRSAFEGATEKFFSGMESVSGKVTALSPEDRQVFDDGIGFAYDKYKGIYDLFDGQQQLKVMPDSQYDDLIAAYSSYVADLTLTGYNILVSKQPQDAVYLSLYENMADVDAELKNAAEGDEAVFNFYYYGMITFDTGASEPANVATEYAMLIQMREIYCQLLQTTRFDYNGVDTSLYEVYESSGMKNFLKAAGSLFRSYAFIDAEPCGDEDARAAKVAFDELPVAVKGVYLDSIDKIGLFYLALADYYGDKLKATASEELHGNIDDVLSALFDTEKQYIKYQLGQRTKEQVEVYISRLTTLYEYLGSAKDGFDELLGELYGKYTSDNLFE